MININADIYMNIYINIHNNTVNLYFIFLNLD